MGTTTLSRLVSLVLLAALVAAACGANRSSDESGADASPASEPGDASDSAPTPDESAADEADGDGAGAGSDDTTTATAQPDDASGDVEMFGDLVWPCGPGDASGATDQGVTDDAIVIGAGDDRGFASSLGLNKAQTDAVLALADKCNELGGINGRILEVEPYDAKLFEVASVMLDACDRVFMLVGEGFAVDGFGEETRVQCDLAHIPAWTVSAAAAHGPSMIQPVPNPADRQALSLAVWLSDTFPEAIKRSATVFGNFGATIETKDKVLASYPEVGFEFVESLEYNVNGEDDWTPFIIALEDAGIEHVYFTGSCLPNYQSFRAAAAVNDFEAIYSVDSNFYESACIGANTDGVMDHTYVRMVYFPFEEREEVKAVDDYMTLIEQVGGEIAFTGAQATSAFLLWATAASACGSDLTRQCVLDEAASIDEWTGGGLHVPTDPGVNEPPNCGVVLEMSGATYRRVFPETPGEISCGEAWVAEFTTEWVEEAELDENRVSRQFTG